jgi:hypothetical protein
MRGKIGGFVRTSPGFQYSINLKYDLLKKEKMEQYVPLLNSVEVIDEILKSNVLDNQQRSRIIVGSYGTGKSHLCLVLLSILGKLFDKKDYQELLLKVKNISVGTEELIRSQIDVGARKFLPVIVTGSEMSIDECLITALQLALKEHNLEELFPKTNYLAAIEQITKWEEQYNEAYSELESFLAENKSNIESLVAKLKTNSKDAYLLFNEAYEYVTHGAKFQPLLISKVEDVYHSVADALPKNIYQGIVIVFDEFGKYLEQQWEAGKNVDLKPLQDIAEACNSSDDPVLQLLLITHKPITQYAANHSEDLVNEWKKIEGRFKSIEIINTNTKVYEIISQVIIKDEIKWQKFYSRYENEFNGLIESFSKTRLFSEMELEDFKKDILEGSYPLHPLTVFCLPRLSHLLAQNERTIFTFLAAEDKYSLNDFLNNTEVDHLELLSLDQLFDYFEPIIISIKTDERIREIYFKTIGALTRLNQNEYNEAKIIKSIAILKILNLPALLPATPKLLQLAFEGTGMSVTQFTHALQNLLNKKILFEGFSTGILEIIEPGEIDVAEELKKYLIKREPHFEHIDFLNNNFAPAPVLAKRYNDEFRMTRYFICHYVSATNAVQHVKEQLETNYDKDGFIYYVWPDSEKSVEEIADELKKAAIERVVFILPKSRNQKIINNIKRDLQELDSLQIMFGELQEEDSLQADLLEVKLWITEKEKKIKKSLNELFGSVNIRSIFEQKEHVEERILRSKTDLTKLVSEICEDKYYQTPEFNNEMINKNNLTRPIIRARQKIVDGLLQSFLTPNLGFKGNGPEVAIYKAVLLRTGIVKETENHALINDYEKIEDKGVCKALTKVQTCFDNSDDDGVLFEDIIKNLCLPPLGIRKGIIPILLAVFIHKRRNEIQLIDGTGSELLISGDSIELAMSQPEHYRLIRVDWSDDKKIYSELVRELFSDYIDKNAILETLPRQIVEGIRRWFVALPKITRETQQISKEAKSFRKSIRNLRYLSSRILYADIPKIFGFDRIDNSNCQLLVSNINTIKEEMESYHLSVIYEFERQLLKRIPSSDGKTLLTSLRRWYEGLTPVQKERLYSDTTQEVLKLVETFKGEDHLEFTKHLLFIMSGIRVEDWSDLTAIGIVEEFEQIIIEVESLREDEVATSLAGEITLEYKNSNGEQVRRTFPKSKISDSGELLKNVLQSYLEEFGDAIANNEKRSILISLLEELL